jgi:hypothetical protein
VVTENHRLSETYIERVKNSATVEAVARARGVALKQVGKELVGLCPFHADKTPSFRVLIQGNVWNCKPCEAAGNIGDYKRTAIGFVMKHDALDYISAIRTIGRELGLSDDGDTDEPMQVVATYEYRDYAGKLLATKDRLEHVPRRGRLKEMRWRGGRPKPWTPALYRAPEVLSAISEREPILLVEGEKKVDALINLGFTATCNEDGAGKWEPEHTEALRGARVVILPDVDEAGLKHGAAVEKALADVTESVWTVKLDKSPDDWLDAGGTVGELGALVADALFDGMLAKARRDLAAVGAGPRGDVKRRPLLEPALALWEHEDEPVVDLVDRLIPEHGLAVQSSHPKTGKTWIEEELAISIATGTKAFGHFETGEPRAVALFLFEDSRATTKIRLGAIAAGKGLQPSEALRRVHLVCKPHLDLLNVDDAAHVVASVRQLPEKPAAVFFDPLRDAHTGDEVDDMDAVARVLRQLSSVLGCMVFVTHHNRKAQQGQTPKGQAGDEMRGGGELRGRIDAGLYPRLVGGDQVNAFELEVTTDKRDGQKAAPFRLSLDIEDEGKRAKTVRWRVDGVEAAKTREGEERVRAALVELNHEKPVAFFAASEIAKSAGMQKARVLDVLASFRASGTVERAVSGKGWRCFLSAGQPRPDTGFAPRPGRPGGNSGRRAQTSGSG